MTSLNSMMHVHSTAYISVFGLQWSLSAVDSTHTKTGCFTLVTAQLQPMRFSVRHALTTVHTHPGHLSTPFTSVLYKHTGRITLTHVGVRFATRRHSDNQWATSETRTYDGSQLTRVSLPDPFSRFTVTHVPDGSQTIGRFTFNTRLNQTIDGRNTINELLIFIAHHGSYSNALTTTKVNNALLTANSNHILRPEQYCHRFFPTVNLSQVQWPFFTVSKNGHTVNFLIL